MTQISKLLDSKNINFTESGRDYLIRCINPEHEDKNPSLRIDRETGAFHCLSCGYKGNIFTYYGAKIDYLDLKRTKLMSLITNKLRESTGLEIPEGATPLSLNKYRGISKATYDKFEAFTHNDYVDRLVFPIRNSTGKIVAFQGRHMSEGKPKYKFYPDHAKIPLYPANVTPIDGTVILVEGLFDMINLHDKGLTNTICTFGAGQLSEAKVVTLKLQGIASVIILYDNDDPGQIGAEKAKFLLEENDIPARIIIPKGADDPGAMTLEQVQRLKEYIYGSED